MNGHQVTLPELLNSREQRAAYQRRLLTAYPGCCLISFMVNMPGAVKDCALSRCLHELGWTAIETALDQAGFRAVYQERRPLATGSEGYILIPAAAEAVKPLMCRVEEEHPLGRLFDIDVLTGEGRQLSRAEWGAGRRKCLLCDNDGAVCARSRAHSSGDLIAKMQQMLDEYQAKP